MILGLALRTEAVILFERYEQKDNSGWPDPAFSRGNAQIKIKLITVNSLLQLSQIETIRHKPAKDFVVGFFIHIWRSGQNP
jgi:hypothetical protein